MDNDLISRKYVVEELLKEREHYPPMVAERYSFGVKLPHAFNQAMRGGIRKGLRIAETAPAVEPVQLKVVEQFKWERDTAIEQLKELGIGFGQKKPDMVEVVRCKDCKHVLEKHYEEPGEPPYIKYLCDCPYGLSNRYGIDKNDFCSRGEHKKAGE